MTVEPKKDRYCLIPYLHVIIYTNQLTDAAKKTFNSNWNWLWDIEFGWLKWHYNNDNNG